MLANSHARAHQRHKMAAPLKMAATVVRSSPFFSSLTGGATCRRKSEPSTEHGAFPRGGLVCSRFHPSPLGGACSVDTSRDARQRNSLGGRKNCRNEQFISRLDRQNEAGVTTNEMTARPTDYCHCYNVSGKLSQEAAGTGRRQNFRVPCAPQGARRSYRRNSMVDRNPTTSRL